MTTTTIFSFFVLFCMASEGGIQVPVLTRTEVFPQVLNTNAI